MPRAILALLLLGSLPGTCLAQAERCAFYAQNPSLIQVGQGQVIEREVEIVYTNTGTSTWQRTGGVSNLSYIELRAVNQQGAVIDGPLYHPTWINRQRVGSYLSIQGGVAPSQRARFVFKVLVDGSILAPGSHDFYFRPYHASGGYISDWGGCHITVTVTQGGATQPQVPAATILSITPNPAASGQAVSISGSATNQPIEYRWESQGQLLSDQASFSRVFASGVHQIGFRARNAQGWGTWQYATLTVNSPSPTSQQSYIDQVLVPQVEYAGPGTVGQPVNLVTSAAEVRKYHELQLAGHGVPSSTGHEWFVRQNGQIKPVATQAAAIVNTADFFDGQQELLYRTRGANGVWSSYAVLPINVSPWPKLIPPVHGSWARSGNDYGEGDHTRSGSYDHLHAQDYNQANGEPANADFGREIIAPLSGKVTALGASANGGRYVTIESSDSGVLYRASFYHLMTIAVEQNEVVAQGQPIGLCGNTGQASTGSHLHYVLHRQQGGAWVSVAPEPVWVEPARLEQSIPHDWQRDIRANSRVLPSSLLILQEQVSGGVTDMHGWGHVMKYAPTVSGQPTASQILQCVIPVAGRWKLFAHNPSGFTNSNAGSPAHNTSGKAVFEVTRSSQPGPATHEVDQHNGEKGALVFICEIDAQQGETLMIRQHNATGEQGKEVAFDELILKLVHASGAGGGGSGGGSSSGGSSSGGGSGGTSPSNPPSPPPPPPPSSSSSSPSQGGAATTPSAGGGGGGGGGCSMSSSGGPSSASLSLLICSLFLVFVFRRVIS